MQCLTFSPKFFIELYSEYLIPIEKFENYNRRILKGTLIMTLYFSFN